MHKLNFLYIFLIIFICSTNFVHAVNKGEILSAETRTGSINNPTQTDSFTFNGEAGQTSVIIMSTESGELEPYVFLYAPDWTLELETRAYFSNHVAINNHQLLQSGLYTIIVRDLGADSMGDYSLSLLLIPGPIISPRDIDGGNMLSGEIRTGTISLKADTDAYTIFGEAGQTPVIHMKTESGYLNPYVFLYAPDGTLEKVAKCGINCSHVAINDHQLLQSGLYTIVVRDDGGNSTGEYSLSFTKIPAIQSSPYIGLILNRNEFHIGDTLIVYAHIVNGPDAVNVEEKIWIKYPNGEQMSIGDPHSTFTVAPNVDITEEIYSYTFDGSEISGDYNIGARLLNPVSGREISVNIEYYNFTE